MEKGHICQKEMKENIRKEHFKMLRAILESKLNARHVFQATNLSVVPTVRYSAGIIELTKEKVKEMDRKTMYVELDQTLGGCTYQEVKEVGGL